MKGRLERVLTLIILAVCTAGTVTSTTAPFTLILGTEENVVKAGSEVKINITLRNSSNRAIHMNTGSSEIEYVIEVRDSQGTSAPKTDFGRKANERPHFSSDQIFTLQPGECLPKISLDVTKLYDLSRPGKYTIQVNRLVPKELGSGQIRSNPITITIAE